MNTSKPVDEIETFEDYMRNARNEFGLTVMKCFPHEQKPTDPEKANMWTEIRVAAENILIAYDQMREKILAGYAAATPVDKLFTVGKGMNDIMSLSYNKGVADAMQIVGKWLIPYNANFTPSIENILKELELLKVLPATPSKDESNEAIDFLPVLEENYQAQIAGFYNDDKTDEERAKRQAVIDEYEDLIAIWKHKVSTATPATGERSNEAIEMLKKIKVWLPDGPNNEVNRFLNNLSSNEAKQ